MKTTLTIQQIIDLGGNELLNKVFDFLNLDKSVSHNEQEQLTFDSSFKHNMNIDKLKIYLIKVPIKYCDNYEKYMIISDNRRNATTKLNNNVIDIEDINSIEFISEISLFDFIYKYKGCTHIQ